MTDYDDFDFDFNHRLRNGHTIVSPVTSVICNITVFMVSMVTLVMSDKQRHTCVSVCDPPTEAK